MQAKVIKDNKKAMMVNLFNNLLFVPKYNLWNGKVLK